MSAVSRGAGVLVSPFESDEAESSYERWFRAKVREALDSKAPRIPHDEVMAMIRERKEAAMREDDEGGASMSDEYIRFVNAKVCDSLANMQRRYSQQEVESIVGSWFRDE